MADGSDDTSLCEPFTIALPISGASVTVIAGSGERLTVCSSNATAARIDELQVELGEGPQFATAESGEIASIGDVSSNGHDAWPVFGLALGELSVGAIFCIPIQLGAVVLGVATLYSESPRELTGDQQVTARAIASAIAGPAVSRAVQSSVDESPPELVLHREVHQATGIVLVQLNTTATIAYSRLQAYAFANGRTVLEVAHDVVTGSLTFEDSAP